jgi:hypothetical protein
MRLLKKNALLSLVNSYIVDSPQPSNISYVWNFGSLLATCLGIQIVTGVLLAMHYTPNVDLAFISVEHIMRDVNYGWMIRYIHANVASFFFIFVYLHIARGLYFGSYKSPRILVWSIGVIMLVLMIGIAFLGFLDSPKCLFMNEIICLNLVPVRKASPRVQAFLLKHNLKPVYIFEYAVHDFFSEKKEKQELTNKKLLNSIAGVYACVNLVNGKFYLGSASIGNMYRRFRRHLFGAKGGSILVNRAVNVHGVTNFAFLVIETVQIVSDSIILKKKIISLEQHYIDTLVPQYNILQKASSVLGLKWNQQQRLNF